MSSARSLWDAFFLMVICIIIGFILLLAIAMPVTNMQTAFTNAGLYDVSAEWNSLDDSNFLVDIIHVIAYAIVSFGVINFLATAVRRQEYDESIYYGR